MTVTALVALAAILSYGILNDGGAHRSEWLQCLLAFGIVGAVYAIVRALRGGSALRQDRRVWWLIAVVVLICGIQLIPLPSALLRIVSPASLEMYRPAVAILSAPQNAPISVVPSETFRGTLNLLAYLLVFALLTDLSSRRNSTIWFMALPLICIGFLEAALGVLQAFYGDPRASVSGTYANRNHFAGLLEMCLPFAVMLPLAIWRRGATDQHSGLRPVLLCCGLAAVSALILIAIVDSLSRMGFIATLVSLFVVAVLAVHPDRPDRRFRWKPVAVFAGLILVSFFLLPSGALIARFGGALSASELTADARQQIWADAVHLVSQYPIFGCGFGAFQSAFMQHQVTAPMMTVNFVHNDYLQLLTELGVAGFIPLLGLAILLYSLAIQRLENAGDEFERLFYVACIGAMTAMTLHSFVDFNLYMPANATVLSWISAMVTAPVPVIWTVEPPRKLRVQSLA